jgi:vacuolar protein sorting-associated protein 11
VIALEKLQSPLQVLQALTAIENGPNLSTVRHYFMQIFQKENDTMKHDEAQAEKYRLDSEVLKKNINMLNNDPVEFRGSLCDSCHQPLVLPALFFLCKHSFHQECIRSYSETEKDCMVCRRKNNQLQDLIHKQNETRNKHETFNNQLKSSQDAFNVIADYFGRGLFNKIVLVSDEDDEVKPAYDDINIPKRSSAIQRQPSNSMQMTEGKIRLEESLRSNIEHKPQLSEGRLRLLDVRSSKVVPPAQTSKTFAPPQQFVPKKPEPKAKVAPINYPIKSNPFDDDDSTPFDEDDDVKYDNAKNPFGDEAGE